MALLLAGLPVHRLTGDFDRQPGQEQCHSCDIAIVFTRLVRAAENDVVDRRGSKVMALDDRAEHVRRQEIRTQTREHAAVAAEGRPQVAANERVTRHRAILRRVTERSM